MRALRALRSLVVLFLATVVGGCATKGDIRSLQGEIRELSSQQQALLRELQESQIALQDSIARVAENLQEARGETARRLTNIEDQLLTVQELAGLSQQQVASIRDQMERDRAQRNFGFTRDFPTTPGGGVGEQGQAGELYSAAMTQYQRGTLSAARRGFQQIVDQFGTSEYASEARYYLADISHQEGDVEGALEGFLQVQEFHPTAPRVADALYRAGTLYLELGNASEAEVYFERVVNTWPDSGAADLARLELEGL